ncbi:hypothetical protein PAAG_11298 [Paracoccidioides lutzii Pb01]|uniref:Uncharacterized protein n=1 Tax=Paracoccidioides lutzii (strain ATCC MYA-826 / Pb01) TaxID=502779 RepID=A0A0A2V333_PARBA|nr:hypothetical protein PAAG_11298 [Paracoccidioides lutzii Pb01]KGQ01908.1 hypothetical protein PAAG_11298 [Paracoccidioides lutzii Pb01]
MLYRGERSNPIRLMISPSLPIYRTRISDPAATQYPMPNSSWYTGRSQTWDEAKWDRSRLTVDPEHLNYRTHQGLRKAVTDSVVRHVWDSMSQELHFREGSAQVQAELL